MNRAPIAIRWGQSGIFEALRPVTLDRLCKDEKFLEDALAANPELLGIQSRRSGIRGPYAVFQQVALPTPAGRVIYPDIVLLAASGHLVVVEVKLSVNSELRDRNVIAQIIDYASSFTMLDEQGLVKTFDPHATLQDAWIDLISEKFPDEPHLDELADLLRKRAAAGEVNLVIACDRTPPGVEDVVAGIAKQQTTGFDFDLVEVVPFVREQAGDDEIVFVPSIRLSTEIVARTAVTITYREGDARPTAAVETTTADEIEQAKKKIAGASSNSRVWPPQEVEEAFRRAEDAVSVELLEFAKRESAEGQYVSPSPKTNPTFGFYVQGRTNEGRSGKLMLFYITLGWDDVWFNLARSLASEATSNELDRRLKELFGEEIDLTRNDPRLKTASIGRRLSEFKALVLWFRDEVSGQRSHNGEI